MKYFLLLLLIPCAAAQTESTILPFMSGVITGAAIGAEDGWDNTWRWANVNHGTDSPEEKHANTMRHHWGIASRGAIVLSVGTAYLAPPGGWDHAAARLALYSSSLFVSHHIAHSIQQGQSLTYGFGCYACQEAGTRSRTGAALLGASFGVVASSAYLTTCESPLSTKCLTESGGVFIFAGVGSWFLLSL